MPYLLRREPLPRHHLEDGTGGTDTNAFPAPGAARLVRIAVGTDDDLGVLAAESDVQHTDDLNVLAGADAARAEDACRHVVADHRVAGALVARTQRQVTSVDRRWHDVVLHEIALELVPRASVERWIPFAEKPENPFAILDRGVRLRGHDHAVGDLGGASRDQLRLAFDGDKADAAVANERKRGIPAEGWNLDTGLAGRIEDRVPFIRAQFVAVNRQHRHA